MRELTNAQSATSVGNKRMLICAEGFEPRSLEWLRVQDKQVAFDHSLILRNIPYREGSRYDDIVEVVNTLTRPSCVDRVDYLRYDPSISERELFRVLAEKTPLVDCVVVDISVMSKLLIVMTLVLLSDYMESVRIIYSEPEDYAPTQEEYEKHKDEWALYFPQPSFGVHSVVRTPNLASVTMQRSPSLVVAFTSFNEQLIPALVSECNPSRLMIANGIPPRLKWRARATQEIAEALIKEYRDDNPKDENGVLLRSVSTLDYRKTFDMLSEVYRENAYSDKIILAPTGSKMQAVACGLFKICCPDVHIEYPIPESVFVPGFSSQKTIQIHEIVFEHFSEEVRKFGTEFRLNG